jgi:ubiquinone/menaquinone biosynthesis C-methylase UbiE
MMAENVEAPTCTIETCDLFDFMAKYVGLSVLHPGGLKATEKMAEDLHISKSTKVIDIACGRGTTALFLAQKFDCQVVGVDISEELIEEAKELAKKKGLEDLITFQVGDALDIPYSDGEFDVAISQAMLILVGDKIKAIHEAMRVIKPGGAAGWIELSWKKPPSEKFMDEATNEMCAYCMENVNTFDAWEEIFKEAGVKKIEVHKNSMEFNGMKSMIADEGLSKMFNVMFKYIGNSRIRNRMKKLNKFILSYPQYFGHGLYVCRK